MIYDDIAQYPHAFWFEPVPPEVEWRDLDPPADLLAFWRKVGCGDLFESETLHGPVALPSLCNMSCREITGVYAERGLGKDFVVFHTGLGLSVYKRATSDYLCLSDDAFEVLARYDSLDEWYVKVLRAEFAERYGLAPTQSGGRCRGVGS